MFIISLFVCVGPEKPRWGVANYVYIYIYIYIFIYYKVINFTALTIFTLGVVYKNERVELIYSNQIIWDLSAQANQFKFLTLIDDSLSIL